MEINLEMERSLHKIWNGFEFMTSVVSNDAGDDVGAVNEMIGGVGTGKGI